MRKLARTAANHLPALVLLANAAAFAVLFAELLLMDHTDGIQRVAPAATATGALLCLVAVVLPGNAKYLAAALFVALSGAGLLGFVRHLDERGGLSASSLTSSEDGDDDNSGHGNSGDDDDDDEDDDNSGHGNGGDDDDDDSEPPPLAPLSIAGTAMLSALATVAAAGRSTSA